MIHCGELSAAFWKMEFSGDAYLRQIFVRVIRSICNRKFSKVYSIFYPLYL